jgi:16S rRNA (guanine(966)-N(2))-methyltransferase RsmD
LFNIIGPDIQGASLLDLFAGTGSVGIEALSRGAEKVVFIELNWRPIATIRDNLKTTGLQEGAEILHADAFTFLEHPSDQKFDYIYIAPPQYKGMWNQAVQIIDRHTQWLSEDAWVIVQIHPVEYRPIGSELVIDNLDEFDQRSYGSTLLVFYRRAEN